MVCCARRPGILALALAFGVVLAAPPQRVGALTVAEAPLEVLLAEADLVVHGHVVATVVEREPGQRHHLRTRVTVMVFETVAGLEPTDLVEVLLPGGTLGRYTTVAPGVPQLAPGDEVVLLLEVLDAGPTYAPLGYRLGTFVLGPTGPDPVLERLGVLR